MGRMERVNQQMKREVGIIIQQEMSDPRLQFVSVTHVNVSPDLHVARVHFSVLGDEKKVDGALEALEHARGFIRRLVGKRVVMKFTPDIEFIYDPSIEYSARVEKTLDELKGDATSSSSEKETIGEQ